MRASSSRRSYFLKATLMPSLMGVAKRRIILNQNRQTFKNYENVKDNNSTEEAEQTKTGASPAMLRLPYALAKERGLSTDGMTPREVWDMLKGNGVDKKAEEKRFIASQRADVKEAPQAEPEQFFETEDIDKLRKELRNEILLSHTEKNPPYRINSAKTLALRQSEIDKHMEIADISLAKENDIAKMKDAIEHIRESRKQIKPQKPPIELPTLSGSEKQVAWADDIRYKMAGSLEGLTELLHDNPRAMELAEQSIKNKTVHPAFNRSRIVQMPDLKMAIAILKETDARWFIDNR